MTSNQRNELTKRLLIRTWPAYAERQAEEMMDQFMDDMTDNLPRYAELVQAKVPQLWPWLVGRSKMTVEARKKADAQAETKADVETIGWLVDLIELYLDENPHVRELYEFTLEHVFKDMSDDELRALIAS